MKKSIIILSVQQTDLGVAQFGSVLEWGSRGREFKSPHSDQKIALHFYAVLFFYVKRYLLTLNQILTGFII